MSRIPQYIPSPSPAAQPRGSKARKPKGYRNPSDAEVELYLRDRRAGVYKTELEALKRYRDEGRSGFAGMTDREITDSANRNADSTVKSWGLPAAAEIQEWRIQREAEEDISSRSDKPYWLLNPAAIDRAATRVIAGTASTQAKVADFATAPIQAALGRSDKDYFSGTASDARNLLDLQSRAATEESSGIGEDLLTSVVQFAGDPAFVGAYTKTRAALRAANAARGQNAARATRLNASDDIIAGGVGDLLASGIRSDFDPQQMKEEFGLGLIGGVAMEGVSRGVGAVWKKAFPDKKLPASRSEAERALDEAVPNWREQVEKIDEVGAATRDLQDEVDNVRIVEAEKQAAKYDPGERIETPEPGAKKGIDRFNDRQAARDAKLQDELDQPHVAKDKDIRQAVDRLEAENLDGKVMDYEVEQVRIQDEVRAEALKDPDTFELVQELEGMGYSRADAEALAIPELDFPEPQVSAAGKSAVGESAVPDMGAPKEPWQMSKSEFIRDTETTPKSNKTDSPSPNKYKDGDLVIDGYGDDPYVYQLQRVSPEELSFSLEGEELSRVVDMPTTQQYIEWYKQGIDPPPVDVVIKDSGARHSTNRRRVVAAREAGVKDIPAFVEIGRHKSMVKQALAEGKPVPPEVLKDYPDLAPTRPVEGASGDQLQMFRSGIAPDDIAAMVSDAIAAGKWTAKQSILATRWAMSTAGDAIRTMRDFAGVMIDKFGRGIRKHIPEMWQRFKDVQARRAKYAQRRQRGAIDLRKRVEARSDRAKVKQVASDPNSVLGKPRNFERDGLGGKVRSGFSFAKKVFDYPLDPFRYRTERISPRITRRLYEYRQGADELRHKLRSEIDPLMNDPLLRKMPKDVRTRINSALINRNTDELSDIVDALPDDSSEALAEFLSRSHDLLDGLHKMQVDAGIPVDYLENHYPRVMRPAKLEALRKRLHGEERGALDDAIKRRADQKYNGVVADVPDDEVGDIVHGLIQELPSLVADPKTRRIDVVPDEFMQYYEPFDVSMDTYIERATRNIAKAKLLGGSKDLRLGSESDFANSVGKLIADEGLTGKEADEMVGLMRSLLVKGESPLGSVTKGSRAFGYIAMMGQVYSTIRQIDDYAISAILNGPINTMRGAYRSLPGISKADITAFDMGMDRIGEEFAAGGSQKAVDLTFKSTGLKHLERHIKDTNLNAALLKARSKSRNNPAAFRKRWQPFFGEKTDELMSELAVDGKIGSNTKTLLVMELGRVQPTTGLEVPQGYLDARAAFPNSPIAGLPVLAYQLRTFGMLRMGTIRRESFKDMAIGLQLAKEGNRMAGVKSFTAGVSKLAGMVAALTASGAAVDQLISWIRGDDETLSGSMYDALLGQVLQNRYTIDQVKRDGASGYVATIAPPAVPTLIDLMLSDPLRLMDGKKIRSLRRIPLFGRTVENMVYGDDEGGRPPFDIPRPPKPPKPPSPPRR